MLCVQRRSEVRLQRLGGGRRVRSATGQDRMGRREPGEWTPAATPLRCSPLHASPQADQDSLGCFKQEISLWRPQDVRHYLYTACSGRCHLSHSRAWLRCATRKWQHQGWRKLEADRAKLGIEDQPHARPVTGDVHRVHSPLDLETLDTRPPANDIDPISPIRGR